MHGVFVSGSKRRVRAAGCSVHASIAFNNVHLEDRVIRQVITDHVSDHLADHGPRVGCCLPRVEQDGHATCDPT